MYVCSNKQINQSNYKVETQIGKFMTRKIGHITTVKGNPAFCIILLLWFLLWSENYSPIEKWPEAFKMTQWGEKKPR